MNPIVSKASHSGYVSVAVIGGGAAGFFAAIKCAEENPRSIVTIFEKGAHVLTKVRISGGGRCNVTHACFDPKILVKNYPRGGRALLGPFHKFQPADTIKWFESRGTPLKTEEDNRLFPTTDTSVTIINALKDAAKNAGVTVRTNASPISITKGEDGRFKVTLVTGEVMPYQRVLLACGSSDQGYEWAQSLGHSIESPVPSLFTFTVPDERLQGLAGISVDHAEVGIIGTDLKQTGPVLVTHWGLSGPAILKLSAWGARVLHDSEYQSQLQVNWTGLTRPKIEEALKAFKKDNAKKSLWAHPQFTIPQRLWVRLAGSVGIKSSLVYSDFSNAQMRNFIEVLSSNTYNIRGKSTFKEEFVTCGGVRLDEVDFRTMESKKCPGLYFAGEILDIDGVTGGFNFQSAWTTGWLAGQAMAEKS